MLLVSTFQIIGEPGAGGSSTPSMVGAVQRWRKEKPAVAQAVWEELGRANSKVEEALDGLRECSEADQGSYVQVLEACSKRASREVRIGVAIKFDRILSRRMCLLSIGNHFVLRR